MDGKTVYETCAEIGGALPEAQRQVFANALIRLLAGRSPQQPWTFAALHQALPETAKPLLLPLIKIVRARRDSAGNAVRRWLRDAGWL